MEETLKFVKLSKNAYNPERGSSRAAGLDLRASHEGVISRYGFATINTDLCIEFPHGTYGRIAGRSGLALYNQIVVAGGVVDPDYRGPIKVILLNHGDKDYAYMKGDKIAQIICEKCCFPEIVEVSEIVETARSKDGFGSTGR